jgi:hypothetical protein
MLYPHHRILRVYCLLDATSRARFLLPVQSYSNRVDNRCINLRLGSSPSQEKSRERRTRDICSISNVTCKNWRENLLLFSTRKPRLRRKNPMVKFGALQCRVSKSVSSYFSLIFSRLFWPLACIAIFNRLRDELEPWSLHKPQRLQVNSRGDAHE